MRSLSSTITALAGAAALLGAGTAYAADGAALYATKVCVTCHGAEGKAPIAPGYPRLAGQDATYLATQIRDIRDGSRSNGLAAVMQGVVAGVTDEEAEAIAAYLAGVK